MDDFFNRPKTRVEWLLGNKCNYKCSYCNEMFHLGDKDFPPDDLVLEVCKDIIQHYDDLGRDVIFEFIGGEPTLIEKIPNIGERLHNYPTNLVIRTNGSASLEWWSKVRRFLSSVVISVHKEFCDINHIKSVVELLQDEKDFHPINLQILFPVTNRADSWNWSLENLKYFRTKYELGELQLLYSNFGRGSNMFLPYSDYQWNEYIKLGGHHRPEPTNNLFRPQPSFTGKNCFAGVDILIIDHKGHVKRSWCSNDDIIGNIYQMPIKWPTDPIVCKMPVCGNGFDQSARKE